MTEVDDEEDLLPELPSLGEGGDEEGLGADELGLADADVGDEEDIGLDDATGLDDDSALFALDLPPKEAIESEDDVDAIPIEGLDGEDEYGWTDANETPNDESWDGVVDFLGAESGASDDGGEEGVEDDFELGGGDDDVSHLPALRGHDPEDDEELAFGADALIAATVRSFDEEKRAMSAALLPRLECTAENLGGGPIFAIDAGFAGGRELFRVREQLDAIDASGIDAPIESLAASESIVVTIEGGGAYRAAPGERFEACDPGGQGTVPVPVLSPESPENRAIRARLAVVVRERGTDAPRLWGRAETGALYRSDDAGASWSGPLLLSPVVALATPEDGGVVALSAGRDAPPQIARSTDGGQRWSAIDGPAVLADGARFVAALGDSIAIACDRDPRGPHLSNDRGKTWARLPGLARTGPIALAREAGGLALYAAHLDESRGRAFVARHRPGGGDAGIVLELADEARVHALAVERRGDHTLLYAATDAGLFRIEIDPEKVR